MPGAVVSAHAVHGLKSAQQHPQDDAVLSSSRDTGALLDGLEEVDGLLLNVQRA
jgi:hypothetical protein